MSSQTSENASPVPDKLLDELHDANQHFHQARIELETQLDLPEPRQQERVGAASEAVRAAEREVEAVTDQIGKTLRGEDGGKAANDPPKSP